MTFRFRSAVTAALLLCLAAAARAENRAATDYVYDWDSPSADSRGSMPLGNGDIGLNVWVEPSGDLVFYISKTDAWSDNVGGNKGLLKLGRVRVKLSPALVAVDGPRHGTRIAVPAICGSENGMADGTRRVPAASLIGSPSFDADEANFRQTLRLTLGQIEITDGDATLRLWVDANRPVIHVEMDSSQPRDLQVAFETLRPAAEKDIQADTVLDGPPGRVIWYYRNQNTKVPQLTNRTFGALIEGKGLVSSGRTTLKSEHAAKSRVVSIAALTAQTPTPEAWRQQIEKIAAESNAVPLETARRQHIQWWHDFWNRSWIFAEGSDAVRSADGNDDAQRTTWGYLLQRFVSACAGRGAYPIKFNGSIFTMDWLKREKVKGEMKETLMSADARDWGGQYWFQNTRPMYWPMLESGDFDMMRPLFRMYQNQLPGNAKAVREFYGHDGAYFAETNPFWGSLPNIKPDAKGNYTLHYFTPILELTAMMLDYFAYTGDRRFARDTLLPIADAGTTFFDQHWRHENGKLLLDPDNAIETYWKARNPAPDIAGLRFDLAGLLALPPELTTDAERSRWKRLLSEIPALPQVEVGGRAVLTPAEVFDAVRNSENPELYAVFPFRLFGLGKPDIELARATFAARRFKTNGCWRQDGVQAALLGDTAAARANVVAVLTRKDKQCRFPAFWDHGSDYVPDEDNGGNGVNTLQLMLMQCEGRRILLLPAWPKQWDCRFKLHAPLATTVEATVRGGRIKSLVVEPKDRLRDVELAEPDGSFRKYSTSTN